MNMNVNTAQSVTFIRLTLGNSSAVVSKFVHLTHSVVHAMIQGDIFLLKQKGFVKSLKLYILIVIITISIFVQ